MYVQEPGGYCGIRVQCATVFARGDVVNVGGTISLAADGERYIDASQVTKTGEGEAEPVSMVNRSLGGEGSEGYAPGITDPVGSGIGLYNKGQLVRVWGRVTAVNQTNGYFYIDDGTGFEDSSGEVGVRVSWGWPAGKAAIVSPQVGWYAVVTGISGSDTLDSGQSFGRVLRLRDQADLVVASPGDSLPPVVTITAPPGEEIHLASGQATAQLAGSGTDDDTAVLWVKIGFTAAGSPTPPTTWSPASYNRATHVWTYDWSSPQTQKVWVRAADFAGNEAIISRDITVSTVTVQYVRPGGAGLMDGSSWANAEDKVGDALAAAASGNEVWVAAGTYIENITMPSGVGLYGGFAVGETYREQRNWASNETVLDGDQSGTVVTVAMGASTAIDGFTIRNGSAGDGAGIYCEAASLTLADCLIRENVATASGGGLYALNATINIAGNVFTANTSDNGGAIACLLTSGQIANNTFASNTAVVAGAIFLQFCFDDLVIVNNIVALNSSGITNSSEVVLRNNDVWGNPGDPGYYWQPATVEGGDPDGSGNIIADPKFVDPENLDFHIYWGSKCRDAGDDDVALLCDLDIDAQPRRIGEIDIGADEATRCLGYSLALTTDEIRAPIGTAVLLTARVWDDVANAPAVGYPVSFEVYEGVITQIWPDGQIGNPASTGSGTTDSQGYVYAEITRTTPGKASVRLAISQCDLVTTTSADQYFYNPSAPEVYLVFVVDSTASMPPSLKTSLIETIDYLWLNGANLRLGGVAFRDEAPYGSTFGISSDVDAFKTWVSSLVLDEGGDPWENPLDALVYAANMAPGGYIALATDNLFHYQGDGSNFTTYTKEQVIWELSTSGCKVYIDPTSTWVSAYQDLAMNGYIESNLASYTFPLLRAALAP